MTLRSMQFLLTSLYGSWFMKLLSEEGFPGDDMSLTILNKSAWALDLVLEGFIVYPVDGESGIKTILYDLLVGK